MSATTFGPRRIKRRLKMYSGMAAATAILAATLPGGTAGAAAPGPSQVGVFDARGDASVANYCIDAPAVLVGQQICGGFLRSTATATSDPRGFALGGLAPAPKISSVPLLIPNNFQGVPVPQQVQDGLRQIKFNNIPSQCQAAFPPLNDGDDDQTCGGPTSGDSALGFIGSGANAHVQSTGDAADPTATRTIADSRALAADLTGLQSTYDNARSYAEGGLNADGNPVGTSRMDLGHVTIATGLLTIDGIVSSTTIAFNGTKEGRAVQTFFKYSAASLAGIPVEITPSGLVLATQKVPQDQVATLNTQLQTVLASAKGFDVRLLPAPPIEVSSNLVKASSGGILVTYQGSTGTDVRYTQLIGDTESQVSAVGVSPGATAATAQDGSGAAASSSPVSSANADPVGASDPATDVVGSVDPGVDASSDARTDFGTTPDSAVATADPATVSLVPVEGAQAPGAATGRQLGDQLLLAAYPAQPLSSSQLRHIYPIFGGLVLAVLVAARLRRRPLR